MPIWTRPTPAPAAGPFPPACCRAGSSSGFTCIGAGFCVGRGRTEQVFTLCLSPVVLLVLLGYSYMKRITRWSHLVLGLALGLAPSAAWIAVRGSLDPRILVLTAAVTLWAGGFDVLYACQDYEHDRAAGLHSLPQATAFPKLSGRRAPCIWPCWGFWSGSAGCFILARGLGRHRRRGPAAGL
jgi:4-hydroxybenzoate polyprenyltransferase